MDLGQTFTQTHNSDHGWLKEVNKHTQMGGTLDPSNAAWVQADHYPDGYLRDGIAVAFDGANVIPFDAGGAGNAVNFAGILFNPYPVTAAIAGNRPLGVAVMVQGYVSLDALPSVGAMVNGGLGADLDAARAAVAAGAPSTTLVWIGA